MKRLVFSGLCARLAGRPLLVACIAFVLICLLMCATTFYVYQAAGSGDAGGWGFAPGVAINPAAPVLAVNLVLALVFWFLIGRVRRAVRDAERFRGCADIAFAYLWETDAQHRFTWLSEAFEGVTGRPAGAFLGRRPDECDISAVSGAALTAHMAEMEQRQGFADFVFHMKGADGEEIWISSSGKPRFTPGGRFLGYRGVDRSVTEHVTAGRRLQQALAQAEAENHAKSAFLAGMSHELRTPLNSIIGFSEVIRDQMFGPVGKQQYVEYANDVVTSGHHLLSLVDDVLDLSRIESAAFELSEEEVRLADVFGFVCRGFMRLAESRGIAISVRIGEADGLVRGDARLVRQMVMNLVSNAIKFTRHGGNITISALRDDEGRMRIRVEDTGIGIPEEHVARVVEPFVQVGGPSAASLHNKGSGLGLSLVKRFIELHGGRLELQSRVGSGTVVDLVFPRERG